MRKQYINTYICMRKLSDWEPVGCTCYLYSNNMAENFASPLVDTTPTSSLSKPIDTSTQARTHTDYRIHTDTHADTDTCADTTHPGPNRPTHRHTHRHTQRHAHTDTPRHTNTHTHTQTHPYICTSLRNSLCMHSQSVSIYSSCCIWTHVVDVHDFQVVCIYIYIYMINEGL